MEPAAINGQGIEPAKLRRTLTLPLLVFYGLGVTIGAGIFALIGEILALAGDKAPLSFLLAGIIAGATGLSYALLVAIFPRAGGEAVFVNRGLGPFFGRLVGYGVVVTGIVSSSVIALAFAGYVNAIVTAPQWLLVVAIIALLAAIAWYGVRQSVLFAAVITVMEIGTLLVIAGFGLPLLDDIERIAASFVPSLSGAVMAPVLSGAVIAFFAFIGFEDIENMAEETVDPVRTAPRAILWTLGITMLIYVLLAVIAVSAPNRDAIAGSSAPLAVLFESVSGMSGKPVASMAGIAMINGILVQIVMAARVLYGMANEGLAPAFFGHVHPRRRTPARATMFVAVVITVLALAFPLVKLAELTSLVTLAVFAMVNLSLFTLARKLPESGIGAWRWWGLAASLVCVLLIAFQIGSGTIAGH